MKWILSFSGVSSLFCLAACGASGTPTNLPPKNYDTGVEVAAPVGELVDNYYSSYRELMKQRADAGSSVDSCDAGNSHLATFADRIALAVEDGLADRQAQLGYISSIFKLPKNSEDFVPNSLVSHPLCAVTEGSLRDTLRKNVPPIGVVQKAQAFTNRMNGLRQLALAGDTGALLETHRQWSRFMMCLAYTESLTTADTESSNRVAAKYDFEKADGVKFYLDPAQKNPKSKFNIGLFQFAPDSGGNIHTCIRAWNLRHPGCAQNPTSNFRDMVTSIASPRQSFNAFCGVVKITDMFAVQVNTTNRVNTHPANRWASGLAPAGDRCVTPFFRVGASYNHFGPLQNSTKKNLNTLLSCVLAD